MAHLLLSTIGLLIADACYLYAGHHHHNCGPPITVVHPASLAKWCIYGRPVCSGITVKIVHDPITIVTRTDVTIGPSRICVRGFSKSLGSSKRKTSGSKPASSSTKQSQPASPWETTTFLFVVTELRVNDDPDNGGVAPRANEYGRWIPPIYANGFFAQTAGRVYRWTYTSITLAEGYRWYDGRVWGPDGTASTYYRGTTMFYCNPWEQFLTANGDASLRNIATSDFPDDRWYPLTFRHDGNLSQVEEVGEEQYLAGTHAPWIDPLGLATYRNPNPGQCSGLAGNLSTVIALAAFSCRPGQLDNILRVDEAWRGTRWGGHNHHSGRSLYRGVVATVYLDPRNTVGSTRDILYSFEWAGYPILE